MDRREHLNEEELAFYVDALRLLQLQTLPSDILEHVQLCMECKTAIMELSSLVPDEVLSKGGRHPYFDRHTMWDRLNENSTVLLRSAAGIVVVLTVGALLYFTLFRNSGPSLDSSYADAGKPDTVSKKGPEQSRAEKPLFAQADRFAPLPMLEGLVAEEFRSTGDRPIEPANGDTIRQDQVFTWSGDNSRSSYTFVVLTNRGQVALRATLHTRKYRLQESLPDGLYYWKVEQGGDLAFMRKFFVVEK